MDSDLNEMKSVSFDDREDAVRIMASMSRSDDEESDKVSEPKADTAKTGKSEDDSSTSLPRPEDHDLEYSASDVAMSDQDTSIEKEEPPPKKKAKTPSTPTKQLKPKDKKHHHLKV